MLRNRLKNYSWIVYISLMVTACVPSIVQKNVNTPYPAKYDNSKDSTNSAKLSWKQFYKDSNLVSYIETALENNQQYNIILQNIKIANNQIRARRAAYLPFVHVQGFAGVEKLSRYTRFGAVDQNLDIVPGKRIPEPLPDYLLYLNATWQVDIWKQLRNARNSAIKTFLSTTEGKNFMVTNLVSEIASTYYELMALDNELEILKENIEIQKNALHIVNLEKIAGRVTELAVRRFEAEVHKNQSRQYFTQQRIIEAKNKINFLVGRYPQDVKRNSKIFPQLVPDTVYSGIPSQLLQNRPDIKQAELDLAAANLDVKVARANFYPVVNINANAGYEAFNLKYFLNTPQAVLLTGGASFVAPLINRNAIKAEYYSANARQIGVAYNYERTVLNAFTEVINQQANIGNLSSSFEAKAQQVEALNRSINIVVNLFQSARADYVEVLLVQRDRLESSMELIEIKKQQLNAMVKMYQVLGGGWY